MLSDKLATNMTINRGSQASRFANDSCVDSEADSKPDFWPRIELKMCFDNKNRDSRDSILPHRIIFVRIENL